MNEGISKLSSFRTQFRKKTQRYKSAGVLLYHITYSKTVAMYKYLAYKIGQVFGHRRCSIAKSYAGCCDVWCACVRAQVFQPGRAGIFAGRGKF